MQIHLIIETKNDNSKTNYNETWSKKNPVPQIKDNRPKPQTHIQKKNTTKLR